MSGARDRGPTVALMTRAPRPGQTKSRLAGVVGAETAAGLARAFLLDAAAAVRGGGEEWRAALYVDPAEATAKTAALTGIADARPQAAGDIGARMLAAAAELGREGYAPVVIAGSDVPTLEARHLRQALRALRRHDAVFGPAEDGGYYLVGVHRAHAALFSDPAIEWGGPAVLARSEHAARRAGLTTARIERQRDIDTAEDLEWLCRHIGALRGRGERVPRHTAAALERVAAAAGLKAALLRRDAVRCGAASAPFSAAANSATLSRQQSGHPPMCRVTSTAHSLGSGARWLEEP